MDALFPPGPQKHLLLGNAVEFRSDPFQTLIAAARDYGETVHFRFGPSHAYLVTSAETIHYVLVERPDLFDARPRFHRAIQSAFGHELFAPGDGVYKRERPSNLLPFNWLDSYSPSLVKAAQQTMKQWNEGAAVNVDQSLRELTLSIAAGAVFGMETTEDVHRLGQSAAHSIALQDRRFTSPWSFRLPIPDRAQQIVLALIHQQRGFKAQGTNMLAGLSQSQRPPLPMVNHLIRLFFLLHETAATTLSWALLLLAQNPETEAEVYTEIARVLGDENPTPAHLAELEQIEMVLRETMRLYPPSWLVSRQARRETRLGDFFVPAGSTVLCSPYIMQRSPRNFVEPEKFLPQRFAAGYEKRMRRYAYAPLGPDSRFEETTLMTEMKTILAMLVQRFRFVQAAGNSMQVDPLVTLHPKGGLYLRLQARR
jgi:cytochrome P450